MSVFAGTSTNYRVLDADDDTTIEDLALEAKVTFSKGEGYYLVGRRQEAVSANKHVVLRVKQSNTAIDDQSAVRKIIGKGAVKIKAPSFPEYDIFVQSTSGNRKIANGSAAMVKVSKSTPVTQGATTKSATKTKTTKKKEAAPRKRKQKADEDDDDDDDDDEEEEKPKRRKEVKEKEEEEEEEEDAEAEEEEKPKTKRQKELAKKTEAAAPALPALPDGVPTPVKGPWGEYPFGLKWTQVHDLTWVLSSSSLPGSEKIAAFDMDSTLVEPKSGAKFPKGRSDWQWLYPDVPAKLIAIHNDGYRIVIFTNQAGIEKKNQKKEDITGKILDLSKALNIPIQAYVAGATDHWRKPHTSMWEHFESEINKKKIDLTKSVFVGDAAGRAKGWKAGAPKDFSTTDRKFAVNIGVPFQTPEEFFHGEKPVKFEWRSLDPVQWHKDLQASGAGPSGFIGSSITKPTQEVVIFVGKPASGKSTFAETHFIPNGYEWINRDTLKTPAKCMKALEAAIKAGKSAVVDNTSPAAASRAEFVDIAKNADLPVRCFVFEMDRALCEHLNFYRERVTKGMRRRVPDVGFNMYNSKFEEPTKKEGYSEICQVKFVPKFKNADDEKYFFHWTE